MKCFLAWFNLDPQSVLRMPSTRRRRLFRWKLDMEKERKK